MSFPAYPSYRDSGLEWLGAVPSHWDVRRLKEIAEAFPSNVDKKAYENDEPIRLCNYTDVYYNDKITSGMSFMEATATQEQIDRFSLRSGDVIITKDSESADDIAIAAFVPDDLPGVVCGYHLSMVRARAANSGAFLKRYFDSPFAKANFAVRANGLTRVGLGQYAVDNVPVPCPPIDEQLVIAAFLDRETARIDALIEEQERLIALLKEKRQAVISHAVTKGLDPTAPMKDSGVEWLREVPAHWEVMPLKYLVNLQSGGTPSKERLDFWDGSIPWVSAKDLKSDNLEDSQDHISEAAIAGSAASLMPAGSVLVLVRGMMLARTFPVCRAIVPMAINQDLKAIEGKAGVSNHFLAWLLRGTAQETLNRLDEAGHGTKALRMDAWLSMLVPFPAEDEQVAIALHLDKRTEQIDALMEETASAKALLQERRSALISAAVTGKIDVREFAPAELEPPR